MYFALHKSNFEKDKLLLEVTSYNQVIEKTK